jgi:hypothetical protein
MQGTAQEDNFLVAGFNQSVDNWEKRDALLEQKIKALYKKYSANEGINAELAFLDDIKTATSRKAFHTNQNGSFQRS